MLQDSGKSGRTKWALEVIGRGGASGVILSPFVTPQRLVGRRRPCSDAVDRITAAGGAVLLDPMTHAVNLPLTNDWDSYDTWDLWDGPRGDVSTRDRLTAHVLRVLEAQIDLGLPPIAPALALDSPVGATATKSLEMADAARSQGDEVRLAVIGSPAFWSQGLVLDDYIGQVAQLRPAGVLISVIRPGLTYPPQAVSTEIAGLCRSVYSLSRRCEVTVQFSDLFGLPALAAGASQIGSGWDLRQRLLAPDAFQRNTTIRRTAKRITHAGLMGVLKLPEAEVLARLDAALSGRLVPGAVPVGDNARWEHHIGALAGLAASAQTGADVRGRCLGLVARYAAARRDFARVDTLARPEANAARWLEAVAAGLAAFTAAEGW